MQQQYEVAGGEHVATFLTALEASDQGVLHLTIEDCQFPVVVAVVRH